MQREDYARCNQRWARKLWAGISRSSLDSLKQMSTAYKVSVPMGDVSFLNNRWYITHTGLVRLARRSRCAGIAVEAIPELSDVFNKRWAFKATVYRSVTCRGFVGYGDADPSNVSPLMHGAEMRIAETRAVNRALRKAYGIGICSIEELDLDAEPRCSLQQPKKPVQPANGIAAPKVRDRLCQIIRQHKLDPTLVKAYAVDFCGTKTLRDATREQVENFVIHLADWAEKDRNGLLCQLNSYLPAKEGAA